MEKKTILIVEDDRDIAMGMTLRLQASGYSAFCATDAASGIEVALKHHPDLILLDLGLPNDNGFVMLKNMETMDALSSVPVIVVSGRPKEVYQQASLLAGAKAYLQKPVENEELMAAIRNVLPQH
jgi:DNA-binding response OmpR family regulator